MFADLLPTLVDSLASQGITEPTEIQARSLGPQLAGRSVLGVSQTGSGKTLAYALPLLHRLKQLELDGSSVEEAGRPRGLVLVPGRELGGQVSRVFKSLTHTTRLRVRVALGGSKKKVARENVAGKFEILVATPGRLLQLLDGGDLSLADLRTLVIDEADQMVDPGFLPVAQQLLAAAPDGLQLVLFSATLPPSLNETVERLFPEPPERIEASGAQKIVSTLTTVHLDISDGRREEPLLKLLREDPEVGTMLFVNTREQSDAVGEWLTKGGVPFLAYRGQMDRTERRQNLKAFREGAVHVLLTTDLGGRGLDIDRVDRVINVHLPRDIDNYLHRVGRTARAGRTGTVINLVTPRDEPLMFKVQAREG